MRVANNVLLQHCVCIVKQMTQRPFYLLSAFLSAGTDSSDTQKE